MADELAGIFPAKVSAATLERSPSDLDDVERGTLFVPWPRPPRVGARVHIDLAFGEDAPRRLEALVVASRPARGPVVAGFKAALLSPNADLLSQLQALTETARARIVAKALGSRPAPSSEPPPIRERSRTPLSTPLVPPATGLLAGRLPMTRPAPAPAPPPEREEPVFQLNFGIDLPPDEGSLALELGGHPPFELGGHQPIEPEATTARVSVDRGFELDLGSAPEPEPEPVRPNTGRIRRTALREDEELGSPDFQPEVTAATPVWRERLTPGPLSPVRPPSPRPPIATRPPLQTTPPPTYAPAPWRVGIANAKSFLVHYERFFTKGEVYVAHQPGPSVGSVIEVVLEIPDGQPPLEAPALVAREVFPPEVPRAGFVATLVDPDGAHAERLESAARLLENG